MSSTGFCGKFLLAMRAVCWRLHWSREENLDWYSDQRWSTSCGPKKERRERKKERSDEGSTVLYNVITIIRHVKINRGHMPPLFTI